MAWVSDARPAQPAAMAETLAAIVGADNVTTAAGDLAFYSQDISGPGAATADVVVRPGSVEELQKSVAAATAAGHAVLPRGAGLSYTHGYTPVVPNSAVLDLGRLDRVVALDARAGRITVEAGCSFAALHAAAAEAGWRAPSFGPLSGAAATIGGGLSQNAAFFGAAGHGFVGDHLAGLDLVLADGRLLTADERRFGPDWAGLFVGDCGAFAVKARATLRLIRPPAAVAYASFAFDRFDDLGAVFAAIEGTPGLAEAWGFDPEYHRNLTKTGFSLIEGAGIVGQVARAADGLSDGLKAVMRLAREGKSAVRDLAYSLHVVVEGPTEAALAEIRNAAAQASGVEIPDTIPRVTRAKPFRPVKALLGPDGENWLPLHGVLPADGLAEAKRRVDDYLAGQAAEIARHDIRVSFLTVLIGRQVVLEPQLFWPDALTPFHRRMVTEAQLARHGDHAARPGARQAVHRLRAGLTETLDAAGAWHFQIGKYYKFAGRIPAERLALLRALKAELDPRGLMNPGAVGL